MKKLNKWLINNLPWLIVGFVALLCSLFIVFGERAEDGSITLNGKPAQISETTKKWIEDVDEDYKSTILYSSKNIPAKVVLEDGEVVLDVPTIEEINGVPLPDGEENIDGRGAYHDTSSYLAYYNSVGIGACINNNFGAQCFALADDFWQNYAGRALSSCGTGAAKGTLNCYEHNAGSEFEMVWDKTQIQPGDWVVTTNGTWGHIFMAMGYYNGGYVSGFGQNQGGGYCPLGGSATNVVNLGLGSFGGAFRPKTYISPEPTPEPTPTPTPSYDGDISYTYKYGDTFGQVLVNLGLDGGQLWGSQGTVRRYTKQLIEQNMLDANGNVYVGKPFTLTPVK